MPYKTNTKIYIPGSKRMRLFGPSTTDPPSTPVSPPASNIDNTVTVTYGQIKDIRKKIGYKNGAKAILKSLEDENLSKKLLITQEHHIKLCKIVSQYNFITLTTTSHMDITVYCAVNN